MARAFILGAGASKGSTLGSSAPPILKDFFGRFWDSNLHPNTFPELLTYVKEKFGLEAEDLKLSWVNFEEVLSLLDTEYHFGVASRGDLETAMEIHVRRDTLLEMAEDVLRPSSVYCNRGTCEHHDRIAASLSLVGGDVVINFNYDVIMDASLRGRGLLSENTPWCFGIPFTHQWDGGEFLAMRKPRGLLGKAIYFKLHGAVNWFRGTGYQQDARLKKWRIYVPIECLDRQTMPSTGLFRAPKGYVGVEPILIPPSFMKSNLFAGGKRDWADVWWESAKKLGTCKEWIVIGFSCGHSDLDARWLLRKAAVAAGGPTIIIADLDPCAVQARLSEVLRGAPYSWGRTFGSLAELARTY